jgi:hypothetical protein
MINVANKRKYARYDINAPFCMISKPQSINHAREELHSPDSAINYFSDCVNSNIEDIRERLEAIKNGYTHYQGIASVVDLLREKVETFIAGAEMFTKGYNPYLKIMKFKQSIENAKEPLKYDQFDNPITKSKVVDLDNKAIEYVLALEEAAKKSSQQNIYLPALPPDAQSVKRKSEQLDKAPVLEALSLIHKMLYIASSAFRDFLVEKSLYSQPSAWPTRRINLSAGGLAFVSPYYIEPTTKIKFGVLVFGEGIYLDATALQSSKTADGCQYTTRFVFDNCDDKTAEMLNIYLESCEIADAIQTKERILENSEDENGLTEVARIS